MKRVLLIDTSFAALPVHRWLCSSGFDVWTIGNRPTDVLAAKNLSRFLEGDYSKSDVVQGHIDRLGIDYVVPGCTDVSMETAMQVRLPDQTMDSRASHEILADKAKFRKVCAELSLPAPRRVADDELVVSGMLIAKPVDSFSGRGISVFEASDRVARLRALETARSESRTGETLVETFVHGQLHSFSCFIESGRVVASTIVREDGSVSPFAVDTSYVVTDFPAHGSAMMIDVVERLSAALHLRDGLLHVQFIWDGSAPMIIEVCRRCPGDLYSRLVELSTGMPYAGAYASYFVRTPPPPFASSASQRHILRHTLTAKHESFEGIRFRDPQALLEMYPLAPCGRTAPPLERIDRVGVAFFEFQSRASLEAGHSEFLARRSYETSLV